jgi:hypothetical protein
MGVVISDIFETELINTKTYLKKIKPGCINPIIWDNN